MDINIIVLGILIGILAGFLSGLLGIGSGLILVPTIHYIFDKDFKVAIACSLLTIAIVSPFGAYRHYKFGNVKIKLGIILGVFGIIGSLIGGVVSEKLPTDTLKILFAITLVLVSIKMRTSIKAKDGTKTSSKFIPLIGFTAGFVSALLGLGGGIVMVPLMVFVGIPIHNAIGTSLMAIIMNATTGTITHAAYNSLIPLISISLAIGGILGVSTGVKTANKLDANKLKKVFSYFLIIIAIYIIYDILNKNYI